MKKSLYVLIFFTIVLLSTTMIHATDITKADKNMKTANDTFSTNTQPTASISSDKYVYVNKSNTKSNENGSKENPYKTINESLINNLKSDSTINIAKGTYKLNTINLNNNITLIGENRANTIITTNDKSGLFNINNGSSLKIINLTIRDYNSTEKPVMTNFGDLTIENTNIYNVFRDSRSANGGIIFNGNNLIVNNSLFDNNTASFGASIYNNNSNNKIYNSTFTNSHTANVGASIYSVRSNMEVYDSTFMYNVGVSGAAIYNSYGNLSINNTTFYANDAEHFYGGAIYSTGDTVAKNSYFISNHANYDGGAITTTSNFTAINCSFEANIAGQDGGAFQNIALDENENGNLTIINTTIYENSAEGNGGGITNKLMTTSKTCGIITIRNSSLIKNSAGKDGGAIYNLKYVDAEYNIFLDNTDDGNNTIVSEKENIISLDNNWWGTSNPNWTDIGYKPDTWVVAQYTNTTPFIQDLETKVTVSINKTNTGKDLNQKMPERKVIYFGDNSTFKENNQEITSHVENTIIARSTNTSILLDNEIITITPQISDITYTLTNNNQTIDIKVNLSKDINGKIALKINGKTISSGKIVNGKYNYSYDIPTSWSKNSYELNTIIQTDTKETLRKNITINIPKRAVTTSISINNKTHLELGSTIEIVANVKMGNISVDRGYVSFKISGKTIKSKVAVVNGTARINYTIPTTFKLKNYTIDIVYSGDANKQSARKSAALKLDKHIAHIDTQKLELFEDSNVNIRISVLDSNNNTIEYGTVCYKINGKTVKTNIKLDNGIFFFEYKTPQITPNTSLKQTLTVKLGENNNHYSMSKDVEVIIE